MSASLRLKRLLGCSAALFASVGVVAAAAPAADAACGAPNIARMWKDGGCAGSYLSMYKNDSISSLSTYGFNDNITSAEAGICQSIRLYVNSGFGGSSQPISAGSFITLLGPTYNNEISSSTSSANAAC